MERATILIDGDPGRADRLRHKKHGHTIVGRTAIENSGGHSVKVVVLGPDCSGPEGSSVTSYDAAGDWLERAPTATIIDVSGHPQPGGDYTMAAVASDKEILDLVNRL